MNISETGIKFLQKHENIKGLDKKTGMFKPYDDGFGFMTIGYGHKIQSGENFNNGLTNQQVSKLFRTDIAKFENAVRNNIKVPIRQNQFDALVSLAYNIGITAFVNSTILKYVNNPKFKSDKYPTPESAWKSWNQINGKVIKGLVNRRNDEWNLFSKLFIQ